MRKADEGKCSGCTYGNPTYLGKVYCTLQSRQKRRGDSCEKQVNKQK